MTLISLSSPNDARVFLHKLLRQTTKMARLAERLLVARLRCNNTDGNTAAEHILGAADAIVRNKCPAGVGLYCVFILFLCSCCSNYVLDVQWHQRAVLPFVTWDAKTTNWLMVQPISYWWNRCFARTASGHLRGIWKPHQPRGKCSASGPVTRSGEKLRRS